MARMNDFELMIIRHGMAEQYHAEGDAERRLTELGEARLTRALPTWYSMDWHWNVALCSPYQRAQRTAEIFQQGLYESYLRTHHIKLEPALVDDELVPHGDLDAALARILEVGRLLAGPRPRVAVFSHNPLVSRLASRLVCGDERGQFAFGQGDMLHLFVPAPSHFDVVLAPQKKEPAPRAVVLGFYPSDAQVAMSEGSALELTK